MKTLALLDLEETLIESFDDALILEGNIRKITEHLCGLVGAFVDPASTLDNLRFNWMSWAIWDWSEKECEVVGDVMTVLNRDHGWDMHPRMWMNMGLSMEWWVDALMKCEGLRVERQEIPQIFTKQDMLLKTRRLFSDFDRVILFDDTVEHGLTIRSKHCTIEFQNIKEMS